VVIPSISDASYALVVSATIVSGAIVVAADIWFNSRDDGEEGEPYYKEQDE